MGGGGVGVPSFGSPEYWEQRFQRDPSAFDWLVPPARLDAQIGAAIRSSPGALPLIHHIGCGTSGLSFQLRRLVERPAQVLNSDYSNAAVEIGRAREDELFGGGRQGRQREAASSESSSSPSPETGPPASSEVAMGDSMRWRTLDLLSVPATAALGAAQSYAVVVDKSTSDCISCVDDVPVALPYALQPSPGACTSTGAADAERPRLTSAKIHPLHILAVNLAYTTATGGRWLCVSYSGARFPFLAPHPTREDEGLLRDDVVEAGFVHPGRLWRLEGYERVDPEDEVDEDEDEYEGPGGKKGVVVHRPKISHHLYVLVRTELRLEMVRT